MCVRGSGICVLGDQICLWFYDFFVRFLNCSDGVVFLFYHFASHIYVMTSNLTNKWSIVRMYMPN
jgi:hypothetical protein